ncbi:hypothetical protein PCASD_01364 [Puccinia coronata f. sp. avenae]|uniref:Phospholipid/glycerol acyltransferase domain-containing protein n=1 Tax=Puccinia coronata f. sp. avenae TaxID=200324 RepID=A0A2N5VKF7_9BASI|nr:hypothetical protein PCASD_01364 [Puccinia coronata f. sp. avenae]
MEKFSTWRDPSTGLAPFVYPLPPLSTNQFPRIAWAPFIPLAVFRTLCLLVVAVLFMTVDSLAIILSIFSVKFHSAFQYYYTTVFSRIALHLLGLTQIPSDPPFTHRTSSQKKITSDSVRPGDLIVCNWSSYVDIIYLAYLYNPIFVLPVLKDSRRGSGEDKLAAKVAGFETKNMIPMVLQTGHPPHYIHPRTSQLKSLTECLREARRLGRPVVFFPEGTTSNNRALLKCPKVDERSVGQFHGNVRIFCLAIKHDPATLLKSSMTVPIPSWPLNLMHVGRSQMVPVMAPLCLSPRSISLKYPKNSGAVFEVDSSSSTTTAAAVTMNLVSSLDLSFDTLSQVSKLKITNHISCVHKASFLEYARSRKS